LPEVAVFFFAVAVCFTQDSLKANRTEQKIIQQHKEKEMAIHDGTYGCTVTGFTNNPNGTLSISTTNGVTSYSYTPTGGTAIPFTPTNQNPGNDLAFSVTISGVTYNFTGAYTGAQGGNHAEYSGSVNDNSPRLTTGSWQATQTNQPLPKPVEDKPYEAHKKAV
jgi:hypothetical protein